MQSDMVWVKKAANLISAISDPSLRLAAREIFEERAAICEFDGMAARADAERMAFEELQSCLGRELPNGVRDGKKC